MEALSFVPKPVLAVIAVFENLVKDGSDKAKGDPFLPNAFFMKQT
jgi:hypothetical protein